MVIVEADYFATGLTRGFFRQLQIPLKLRWSAEGRRIQIHDRLYDPNGCRRSPNTAIVSMRYRCLEQARLSITTPSSR